MRDRRSPPLRCAYPLRAFYLFAFPLNWLLNRAPGAILARFGVAEATHRDVLSDAGIKGAIDVLREHGDLSHTKADMLTNMLDSTSSSPAKASSSMPIMGRRLA